jgi:sugar lactone lactonase YvrE
LASNVLDIAIWRFALKERHTSGRKARTWRLLASILFPLILIAPSPGSAQTTSGIITTYAGSGLTYVCPAFLSPPGPGCDQVGAYGYKGDGMPATSALLFNPWGVAVDSSGNVFIADTNNNRIRKVTSTEVISTVVGTGQSGFSGDGGAATSAQLNYPQAIAVDVFGNLFIADSQNHRVRKVTPDGVIHTIAGNGQSGSSGDGGPAIQAALSAYGVAVDLSGDVFITDVNRIREVTPDGLIHTVAANGTPGLTGDGGPATSASLNSPYGIAVDPSGTLYIADHNNDRVRKVTPDGVISSVGIGIEQPTAVTTDAVGNVFVSDGETNVVWEISASGATSLITGSGRGGPPSGDCGPANSAVLNSPIGLAVDTAGDLFIAEMENSRIRKVTGIPASDALTFEPQLVTHLPAGFYIVEATLAQGSSVGIWGMEVLTGQSSGGFDLGGGSSQTVPGFGAFYLATPQMVTATATTPLAPAANITLRLLDSNRQRIAMKVGGYTGTSSLQAALQPGFYIVEVTTDRVLNYSLALSADSFSGGVDVGGYIGPGITGFGAFYLPVDQDVSMRMFGRNTYGPIGAGSLVMTLRDANRNVIQQVGP